MHSTQRQRGERENWLVRVMGQRLRRRKGNKIYQEKEEEDKTANCVGQITEN